MAEPNIETTLKKVFEHAETRLEYAKIGMYENLILVCAKLVSSLLALIFFLLFYLLFIIGISLYIGQMFSSSFIGFLIISGVHLFLFLVVVLFKKAANELPLMNVLTKTIFKDENK